MGKTTNMAPTKYVTMFLVKVTEEQARLRIWEG
jgi:hypothetical protein